jgi:hypothetical protein
MLLPGRAFRGARAAREPVSVPQHVGVQLGNQPVRSAFPQVTSLKVCPEGDLNPHAR